MAASINEFYVRTTGSNLNSGDTNTNASDFTYVGGTYVQATGVFTCPGTSNPVADGVTVGRYMSIYAAGSTSTGFVGRVTAVTAGAPGTITVSVAAQTMAGTNPSNGTYTAKIGGAFAGPSGGGRMPFTLAMGPLRSSSSSRVRVNVTGTYNVAAAASAWNLNLGMIIEGYSTTPGDGGFFIIQDNVAGASFTLLSTQATTGTIRNMWLKGNTASTGGANGLVFGTQMGTLVNVRVSDVRGDGIQITSGATGAVTIGCEVYGCNRSNTLNFCGVSISEESTHIRLHVHHCSSGVNAHGVIISANAGENVTLIDPLIHDNTGNGIKQTQLDHSCHVSGGVIARNGLNGADFSLVTVNSNVSNTIFERTIFYGNTGTGLLGRAADFVTAYRCAFGANGTAMTSVTDDFNTITLTADPFTNAANGDFRLNNTAGGGALLRAITESHLFDLAAYPTGVATSYADIGPLQHQEISVSPETISVSI